MLLYKRNPMNKNSDVASHRTIKKKSPSNELLTLSYGKITPEESKFIDQSSKLPVIFSILKDSRKRQKQNLKPRIYDNLFGIITNEQVLIAAYSNLYVASHRATTSTMRSNVKPNTSGNSDGFSMKQLRDLQTSLINQTWTPTPVKQVWIPKPGKTTLRPLGLPDFNDKVVGEAIRMVLHAVYEPEFELSNVNFGFRPGYSTHSCFKNIETKIQGLPHAIEGDVKGAYPSLNHNILMELLKKRIKDKKFLKTIHRLLKAGIMDTLKDTLIYDLVGVRRWGPTTSPSRSPILWNIYFQEFDKYIANQLESQIQK
jgi:retron-type reverse transcriptase